MNFEKRRFTTSPPTTFAEFILDEEKCTGCAKCVKTCPIQILEMKDNKARPNKRYREHRCITCQNCIAVCKQDAIQIKGDYRVHRGLFKNDDIFPDTKTMPEPIEEYKNYNFEDYEDKLTETERVIYKRRSIRLYKKKPVSRELIKRVIEAGRFAPSAGNNQPWKFIVIDNKETIDNLDMEIRNALRYITYLTVAHAERDKKTPGDMNARLSLWQKAILPWIVRKNPNDFDPRVTGGGINAPASDPDFHIFFRAPVLILLLSDYRGIGKTHLDTGICGQNMTLAAHSLGLGACYVGLIDAVRYSSKLKKMLGIKHPFEIITSIALGYPQGDLDKSVAREPARIDWLD
ncbi:MAG: 4Fe-4S binding protein [Desulfobacterales bacterium]|jgi:nitroreductase/ferredoxin|nr:4Fe-4S binding protein [Desulfobacterales bacterium]